MVLIPKGRNTPEFLKSIGIFETDLNLAIEALKERLSSEGWTADEVGVLVMQLLRGVQAHDQAGNPIELP